MNSNIPREFRRAYSAAADPAEREAMYTSYLKQLGMDESRFHQEVQMTDQYVQMHRDVSFSHHNVALHSHGFWEILCCCSTCGMEYLLGTERYRLQKGDIILVPPGISHRPIFPEVLTEPYSRYVLWVSREFVERVRPLFPDLSSDQLRLSLLRTSGTRWEYLEELFLSGVLETESKKPYSEVAVLGCALTLVTHLTRALLSATTAPTKAEVPGLVDQVIAYVEEHMAEKITLADIAKVYYVSESTVSQTFRKKMGTSFYKWVTQRRLIAAKELILLGTPMEDVSRRVGFQDYSAFFRAFRQEYGLSPREFRQASR